VTHPLTLLQRAVIERLRKAKATHAADVALREWRSGRRVTESINVPDTLLEDFHRADRQASPEL
jgi:hypothetical protein